MEYDEADVRLVSLGVPSSRVLLGLLAVLAAPAAPVAAQAAEAGRGPEIQIGVEARRDRLLYHFDNPSSLDTSFLVPHFFEQRYVADNLWVSATVRYLTRIRWETSIGATPVRDAVGDDYDTFFDPSDTVWTSGTTGPIAIRSFRVSQIGELAREGPVRFRIGYRFRLDRADFGVGHKTVTRNGVLVTAVDVTSPETTGSQIHEVVVGAGASRVLGDRWSLALAGEVSPTMIARLAIELPEKYPGQTLVFLAKPIAASGRATLTRRGKWPVEASVDVGRTWNFSSTNRLTRDLLGVRVSVGKSW